jgi:hypothetical protein
MRGTRTRHDTGTTRARHDTESRHLFGSANKSLREIPRVRILAVPRSAEMWNVRKAGGSVWTQGAESDPPDAVAFPR